MSDFKKLINLFITYINLLFIIRVTEKCFKINNFSYVYFTACFFTGAFIYHFYNSLRWKRIYKTFFTLAIIFIGTLLFYHYKIYILNKIALNIKYILELNDSIFNGKVTFFHQYKFIIGIIIPLIVILVLNVANKLFSDFIVIVNLEIMLFYWYYGYVEIIKQYTFYFVLLNIFTWSINSYISNIKSFNIRSVKNRLSIFRPIIYIMIFSILLSSIQSFLPKNIEGKYYSENGIFNGTLKSKKDLENSYNIADSGYDPTDKKLGGAVVLDSREAFKVASDKPYYLRGITKQYYDGFSWKTYEDSFKKVNFKNSVSIPDNLNESQKVYITIYPTKINTSTLFAPINTISVNNKKSDVYVNKDKIFLSSKIIKNEYKVEFYDSFNNNSVLNINELPTIKYNNLSEDYKEYLQLPDNIPRRVYDLVEDITKDSSTVNGKIKNIYDFLHKNFKYSLNVSDVPEGKEFVSYFLFEEKEGYCTYFATAATVMLRMIGVPARYVEGFNMSYDKDVNGLYIVSNKNAHAWAEILVSPELDSWTIFDATPQAFDEIERHERERIYEENVNNGNYNKDNKNNIEKVEESEDNIEYTPKTSQINYLKYLPWVISMLFIIRICYIIIKKNKLIRSNKSIPLYLYILKRLKTININMNQCEGEMECLNRLEDEGLRLNLKKIVECVCEEHYGCNYRNTMSIEEKKYCYYFVENYIKEKQGLFKYYILKLSQF
ncbi:transglutaminase-like domain-containing protein [uncultured Clostridium sp.]|uniref:transglutaminase-like domain-containing protein n=1 Tax=uncultured Clostridium sp. TaxID=59620 RepID=UPI0028EC5992|nr:transglutaminase-like domain-containing protein [uncultured Clostridium sp.]